MRFTPFLFQGLRVDHVRLTACTAGRRGEPTMSRPELTAKTTTTTDRMGIAPGPQKPTPHAVNYAFVHRGTVIVQSGKGGVRMELYQRRSLARLSFEN
jgi:hypothetical protein